MPDQPLDPTTDYARAVVAGEIVAGRPVRLAAERHLRDLETGHERGLRWDVDAANRAIGWFGFLTLGDGRPFELQPFQQFITGCLFGWFGADNCRRFRTAYIEIGKGNGKALALDTPIPTPAGWTTRWASGSSCPADRGRRSEYWGG
jgi:phage terminase large subunit-like protein